MSLSWPKLWYQPVTPRFHGYGDATATYIRRSELPPHIYAKHQYRQESEYGSKWCIIHSNTYSTTTQLSSEVITILHEYHITEMRKCGKQGNIDTWTVQKSTHVIAGDPRYRRATLIVSGRIQALQAPWPGHESPGESVKLPRRVWYKTRWRARVSTNGYNKRYQVQKTGLEHQYVIISIKREIQEKADISKIDCIRLNHGPMRIVHRRNNPNKETLIYIPLSHATEISKRIESEMQFIR